MLTVIIFVVGLTLIFLFGYKLCGILLPGVEKPEQLSLGYLLGIGIFTFIWFLLNWIGIPYTLASGMGILLLLNLVAFGIHKIIIKNNKAKNNLMSKYTYYTHIQSY